MKADGFDKTTIIRANSSYEAYGFFYIEIMEDPIPLEDVYLEHISIHDDLCVEINGQNLYKSVNNIMKRAIYPKKNDKNPSLIVLNGKISVTYP
ncbi:hypothetical protein ACQCWI_28125 [Bacillus thuringiensis]|uniref:hypothetical protein n=1 Tax=Bacillus thuringiensis TaxID=1428 RepID=UPI003CE7928B